MSRLALAFIMMIMTPGIPAIAADAATRPAGRTAEEIADSRYEMRFPDGGYPEEAGCVRGDARPWFKPEHPNLASHAFKPAADIAAVGQGAQTPNPAKL